MLVQVILGGLDVNKECLGMCIGRRCPYVQHRITELAHQKSHPKATGERDEEETGEVG